MLVKRVYISHTHAQKKKSPGGTVGLCASTCYKLVETFTRLSRCSVTSIGPEGATCHDCIKMINATVYAQTTHAIQLEN